ncbi:MAG: PIN domain-containing protein [Acidobacteria bacterium]|nr:PIN domain-containing protein [Acidobacteriota bacterium]
MTSRLSWLLDTNVAFELMRARTDRRVARFLSRIANEQVGLAAISVWEVLNGIRKLRAGRRRSALDTRFRNVLDSYRDRVLPWTEDDARVCARIMEEKRRRGESLDAQLPDAFLAAVAVRRGLTIVTRNTRDFENTGARTVNPWKDP